MEFINLVNNKIHRKSKPIKKQWKVVNDSLRIKKINLEDENFDILNLLYNSHSKIDLIEIEKFMKNESKHSSGDFSISSSPNHDVSRWD
jgi:hypothetical protein